MSGRRRYPGLLCSYYYYNGYSNYHYMYCCLLFLIATRATCKVLPTNSAHPTALPPSPAAILPVSYRLSNTRLAFFLREAGPLPAWNSSTPLLQRSEPFVVFQTKELPILNVTLGPFAAGQVLPKELLQPSSTLEVPDQLTVNWKIRAYIIRTKIPSTHPVVQVLFYVAGRDWDDFSVTERLPCVRLHIFRDVRDIKSSCRLRGNLATCLAQVELPQNWFGLAVAPMGRRKSSSDGAELNEESLQIELFYTLHAPDSAGGCSNEPGTRRGGEAPTQHPLLRIGSISLYKPILVEQLQEQQLDTNVFIRLPDRPLRPGEILSIMLYLVANSTVEHFTLRVKAKKGINLQSTKSRDPQWLVNSELLTGGKHSTATVDVSRVQGMPYESEDTPYHIMQLDFEMENFTSQSVTRRIMWHVDYRGRNPPPDLEKAVTELTVIQKDIRAIVPLAMDTEIINTAILTGRTVAIPVKVLAIETSGIITDITSVTECKSSNEDIIKVSSSCDYVFVSGKETRGSMNAQAMFSYEHLSAPLEMTVWVPKIPLYIELSDSKLSQVKGWRIPILPDRRSVRDSDDDDDDEDDRKLSRGCTLQYQHATLQVFTQFHTTSSEGTDQVITMLGPDWLVEVTDLVNDFMQVEDPRIAEMVDSNTVAGREPGTTLFKVVSPLMETVLGQTPITVTEEKVSIAELRAQVISGLTLSLHPSPGNSHTIIAKTSAQHILKSPKQEGLLNHWLTFSDGSSVPLSLYDPKDYTLSVSSLDERVISVSPDRTFPIVTAGEEQGTGTLLRTEMIINEICQKTKRKSILSTATALVQVMFGPDEPGEEDEPGKLVSVVPPHFPGQENKNTSGTTLITPLSTSVEDLSSLGSGEYPLPIPTVFPQLPRGLTDLEIGMYALLGVFCLAILVFLINCIVFVLKYRHKRVPPEGQANPDHSHHWVFLGNGQPLRARGELSPQPESPGNALEAGSLPPHHSSCCRGEARGSSSNSSSQASVQSQSHGRGDGSSGGGGSSREASEDPLSSSPTSKRKRVKFTTFTSLPSEGSVYDAVPGAEENDMEWVCRDMGLRDPQELRDYIRRVREMA
ncbi:transmembrane protein 132E [Xenopus tropicalis]|uniref:Transmembrane protein 132E n=1 Tax=Xenopus tropicalis TaxID=8364 RepID=A0A6I8S8N6_XENTR|nr:transmembrane protein 132E [Xenopus tropicalis]|eukprot:XP_002940574.2 PREDICTED: transmembrane protein 132E [Xenopus tropicalis]